MYEIIIKTINREPEQEVVLCRADTAREAQRIMRGFTGKMWHMNRRPDLHTFQTSVGLLGITFRRIGDERYRRLPGATPDGIGFDAAREARANQETDQAALRAIKGAKTPTQSPLGSGFGRAMSEINYHRMKDGSVIALFEYVDHEQKPVKWAMSKFDASDMEDWMIEFSDKDEAMREFRKLKEEDASG